MPDIQSIPANPYKDGDDKIIGDLHGNIDCVNDVLRSLKPHDRLFIVGDAVDRGKDSPGVIRLLKQHKDKIFVIRGNHEDLCLNSIAGLERLAKNNPQSLRNLNNNSVESFTSEPDVATHVLNGGEWLTRLFKMELATGKITAKQDGTIEYRGDSQVKMIKDYMSELPYIMHVQGEKPFNMVHADMPFDDETLKARIKNNKGLSDNEKEYVTWAREVRPDYEPEIPTQPNGRDANSITTYVGHDITAKGANAVRQGHICNLDVGAFATNVFLVVNHTKGVAAYLGNGVKDIGETPQLVKAEKDINTYLKNQNNLKNTSQITQQLKKGASNFPKTPLPKRPRESQIRMGGYRKSSRDEGFDQAISVRLGAHRKLREARTNQPKEASMPRNNPGRKLR